MLKVELLSHTPVPEKLCTVAAKLCYSPGMPKLSEMSPDKAIPFLEKILSNGHLSTLEHATFTFGIEGISRACSHQLVRHRLASYSQQSQRYVSHAERFAAVVPPSIKAKPQLNYRFDKAMQQLHWLYKELVEAGIPAEDARFVLPNAAETKLIMTMNIRELLHLFSLRCCKRAQWEIRALANEMLQHCKKTAPALFKLAGPGCVTGSCPEGDMGCGNPV